MVLEHLQVRFDRRMTPRSRAASAGPAVLPAASTSCHASGHAAPLTASIHHVRVIPARDFVRLALLSSSASRSRRKLRSTALTSPSRKRIHGEREIALTAWSTTVNGV